MAATVYWNYTIADTNGRYIDGAPSIILTNSPEDQAFIKDWKSATGGKLGQTQQNALSGRGATLTQSLPSIGERLAQWIPALQSFTPGYAAGAAEAYALKDQLNAGAANGLLTAYQNTQPITIETAKIGGPPPASSGSSSSSSSNSGLTNALSGSPSGGSTQGTSNSGSSGGSGKVIKLRAPGSTTTTDIFDDGSSLTTAQISNLLSRGYTQVSDQGSTGGTSAAGANVPPKDTGPGSELWRLPLLGPDGWKFSRDTGEIDSLIKQGYKPIRADGTPTTVEPFNGGTLIDGVPINTLMTGTMTEEQRTAMLNGGKPIPQGVQIVANTATGGTGGAGEGGTGGTGTGTGSTGTLPIDLNNNSQLNDDLTKALLQLAHGSLNQGNNAAASYGGVQSQIQDFIKQMQSGASSTGNTRDTLIQSLLNGGMPGGGTPGPVMASGAASPVPGSSVPASPAANASGSGTTGGGTGGAGGSISAETSADASGNTTGAAYQTPYNYAIPMRGPNGETASGTSSGQVDDLIRQGYIALRSDGTPATLESFMGGTLIDGMPINAVITGQMTAEQAKALTAAGRGIPPNVRITGSTNSLTGALQSAYSTMNDATGLSPEAMVALRQQATEGPQRDYQSQIEALKTSLAGRGAAGGQTPADLQATLAGYAPLMAARDTTREGLLQNATLANEAQKFASLGLNRQTAASAMGTGAGLASALGNIYNPSSYLSNAGNALSGALSATNAQNAAGFQGLSQAGNFLGQAGELQPGSFGNLLKSSLLSTGLGALTQQGTTGSGSILNSIIGALGGLFKGSAPSLGTINPGGNGPGYITDPFASLTDFSGGIPSIFNGNNGFPTTPSHSSTM